MPRSSTNSHVSSLGSLGPPVNGFAVSYQTSQCEARTLHLTKDRLLARGDATCTYYLMTQDLFQSHTCFGANKEPVFSGQTAVEQLVFT